MEGLLDDLIYSTLVEATRAPKTGKVDPYAAAGVALGLGKMKIFEGQMRMAAHLGAAEALDDENDWRKTAEDGFEYGLDPEDYETEEEYRAELEKAKKEFGAEDTQDE